jgi:hypothetical protein
MQDRSYNIADTLKVKMTQAAEELTATLLTIEGEGDTEAANATGPVDFVPMYPAE